MSLGGEVTGRDMRPGRKNNQHGEPRRSLEGLNCLGMLAGNASEHASSVHHAQGQRRAEIGIAPPPASSANETSPARGLERWRYSS